MVLNPSQKQATYPQKTKGGFCFMKGSVHYNQKSRRMEITEKDKKLLEEIKTAPEAYEKLRAKARWEQMGLYAVLRDYGDPRKW